MASNPHAGSSHASPRAVRLTSRLQDGRRVQISGLTDEGMSIEAAIGLEPGQELVFELRAPGSPVVFIASGVVTRVHRTRAGAAARVRFTNLRMLPAR